MKEEKKEKISYPTDDIYYETAVLGLFDIKPVEKVVTPTETDWKVVAIYDNTEKKLPAPSSILVTCGERSMRLSDYVKLMIQIKREMFRIKDNYDKEMFHGEGQERPEAD